MHTNEQNQDSLFFQPVEVLIHHRISPGTSLQTSTVLSTNGRIDKSDWSDGLIRLPVTY